MTQKGQQGLPRWHSDKDLPANAGDTGSILGREDPWSRKWQPALVVLSGKFQGQRIPAGYSPWGRKELDMTE